LTKDEYYAQKKQRATEYPSAPAGTYTIDIPGMRDIFKLPLGYMNDKDLKRQRIKRFKTHKTPVPESFNWIPDVITKLDNAQDLVYTAFFIARPLLRRLPARFIPFIGWAILAMDIANLINGVLGFAMTPGMNKPCMRKTVKGYRRPKKLLYESWRSFMAPAGWRRWIGFALQAPQALESVTGYGLILGSIMGSISDTLWSIPRALSGDKIVWRGPPPADPVSKAFNYLTSDIFHYNMKDILSPEEHALILIAHNAALSIIFSAGAPIDFERTNTIQNIPVITHEPWELSTLEVLEEEGIDIREDIDAFSPIKNPTYDQAVLDSINQWHDWEQNLRGFADKSNYDWWSTVYQVYTEASYDVLEKATGVLQDDFLEDDYKVKAATELAALDIMPLIPPTIEQIQQISELAFIKARSLGSYFPTSFQWEDSMKEICGPVVSKVQRITKDLEWNM